MAYNAVNGPSPLSTGLGAIAAFLSGRQQQQQYKDLQAEQAKQDAAAAAQAAAIQSLEQKRLADQEAADAFTRAQWDPGTPGGAHPAKAATIGKYTAGPLKGQTKVMPGYGPGRAPGILYQQAEALSGLRGQEGTYYGARANYENSRPAFDQQMLQYRYASLDANTKAKIAALATRIRVAGMHGTGNAADAQNNRLLIAALTYERMQNDPKLGEQQAQADAMKEYELQFGLWAKNQENLAGGKAAIPGAPTSEPQPPSVNITNPTPPDPMQAALTAILLSKLGVKPPAVAPPAPAPANALPPGAKPGDTIRNKKTGQMFTVGPDMKLHPLAPGWGSI